MKSAEVSRNRAHLAAPTALVAVEGYDAVVERSGTDHAWDALHELGLSGTLLIALLSLLNCFLRSMGWQFSVGRLGYRPNFRHPYAVLPVGPCPCAYAR